MPRSLASSTTASFETIRDAATGGHGEKPAKTTTLPSMRTYAQAAEASVKHLRTAGGRHEVDLASGAQRLNWGHVGRSGP